MGRFGFTFPKIKFEVKFNFQDPTQYLVKEVFGSDHADRSKIGLLGSGPHLQEIAKALYDSSGSAIHLGVLDEALAPSSSKHTVFATTADLTKECGLILTFAKSPSEAKDLYEELSQIETETKFLDFSYADPATFVQNWTKVKAKGHLYMECALVGQQFPEEDGRMLLFVGSVAPFYETMKPFLNFISPRTKRVGRPGKATIAKGIADALHASYTVAAAEALAACKASGLHVPSMARHLRLVVEPELHHIGDEARQSKEFNPLPRHSTLSQAADSVQVTLDSLPKDLSFPVLAAARDSLNNAKNEYGSKDTTAVYMVLDKKIPEPDPDHEAEPSLDENTNNKNEVVQEPEPAPAPAPENTTKPKKSKSKKSKKSKSKDKNNKSKSSKSKGKKQKGDDDSSDDSDSDDSDSNSDSDSGSSDA